LAAFAAERQHPLHGARSYRSKSPAQQQTRQPLLLLSIDWTDERTDARPLHRPFSAGYAGSINN